MTVRQGAMILLFVAGALHLALAWMSPVGTTALVIGLFGLLYLGVAAALGLPGRTGMWLGRTIPAIGALVALGGVIAGQQPAFPWMVPLVILDVIVLWLCWSRRIVAHT